jgi:hypothetical protein
MPRFRDWLNHALGLAGQLIAASPQVIIALYLARLDSLESAGHFTAVAGFAAAAFTVAAWGFVPHMVIERFQRVPAVTYLAARGVALLLVGAATLWAGSAWFPDVPASLMLAVVVLRTADAIIDLQFGFAQVWLGAERAIQTYARLHFAKLALLAIPVLLVATWRPEISSGDAVLAGSAAAFAGTLLALLTRRQIWLPATGRSGGIASLFTQATWLGLAAILCAVVTNLPRIGLPLAYDGARLGVAGISLTIATFFGMAFYTAWIRHFARVSATHERSDVIALLRELLAVAVLCALAAIWPLPLLAGWLFDFDVAQFGGEVRSLLLAAVVFFAGMGLVNLYKLSRNQALESLAYLIVAVLALTVGRNALAQTGLAWPMVAAGVLMAAAAMPPLRELLGKGSRGS